MFKSFLSPVAIDRRLAWRKLLGGICLNGPGRGGGNKTAVDCLNCLMFSDFIPLLLFFPMSSMSADQCLTMYLSRDFVDPMGPPVIDTSIYVPSRVTTGPPAHH